MTGRPAMFSASSYSPAIASVYRVALGGRARPAVQDATALFSARASYSHDLAVPRLRNLVGRPGWGKRQDRVVSAGEELEGRL